MRRSSWLVATTSTAAVLAMAAPAGSAIAASRGDGARAAQRPGVQQVPKHQAGKKAGAFSNAGKGANPLIALLPDPSKADYAYWKSALKQQSARRAAKRAAVPKALAPEPLLVDEEEPEDFRGSNDTLATAQRIPAFGSASDRRLAARILGTLAPAVVAEPFVAKAEDNGSIPLTDETGLSGSGSSTTTEATIGDGPHGSDGDASGDFDFYAVRASGGGSAAPGRRRHAGQRARLGRRPLRRRGERDCGQRRREFQLRQPPEPRAPRPTATTTCR